MDLGTIEEIYISPSAINNFDACEKKFYFSRMLKSASEDDVPIYFKRGSEAHEVMEGVKGEADVSPEAWQMASKMQKLVADLKIQVNVHELTQKFDEVMGLQMKFERRIDALGYDNDGTPIIIDWKTASRKWSVIPAEGGKYVAPKALTWQTPGYFLEPPVATLDELGLNHPWPSRMVYIVGPLSGQAQIFRVDKTDEMMNDFQEILWRIWERIANNEFLMSRGYGCGFCDFTSVCYNAPNWEENFILRFDKTNDPQ